MPRLRHRGPAIHIATLEPARHRGRYRNGHDQVVYYLRFRDVVKIGTTHNIHQRINSLPHEGVLALELGGVKVERSRHKQFAHLWQTGEWFKFEPDLAGHIVDLRAQFEAIQGMSTETWLDQMHKI